MSVVPTGAFVEVADGVHGLLPKTEWHEEPEFGDALRVRILGIDVDSGCSSLQPT